MTTGTTATDGPPLAMALVIRDEARFLRDHLLYHRAMGVRRAYVYLDRCTDDTPAIAESFDWVEAIHRDRDPADRFMSEHQTKCLADAAERARAGGIRWLIHVDPDEFARGDDPYPRRLPRPFFADCRPIEQRLAAASLTAMLARLPDGVDQVVLRPMDGLPIASRAEARARDFATIDHFQNRGAIRRDILDPTTGKVVRFRQTLGHYKGKAIIRLDAANGVQPASAHRWQSADGGKLATLRAGLHYHYITIDAALWLDKHRKFAEYPATWQKGSKVRFPRQAWKQASTTMSDDEALAYFEANVAVAADRVSPPSIAWMTGRVVQDDFVRRVLDTLRPRS